MITRRKIIYRHILWPNFYYGRSFFALLHERKASTQNYKFQIKYFLKFMVCRHDSLPNV